MKRLSHTRCRMPCAHRAIVCIVLVVSSPLFLGAGETAAPLLPKAVSLNILPKSIQLGGLNRRQQLVVTAKDSQGNLFDATHDCRFEIADPSRARVDGTAIEGITDGTTQVRVAYGALKATASVSVTDFANYPPVHFVNDVIPILSKLNCNSSGCHGKQSGQNGFKLTGRQGDR